MIVVRRRGGFFRSVLGFQRAIEPAHLEALLPRGDRPARISDLLEGHHGKTHLLDELRGFTRCSSLDNPTPRADPLLVGAAARPAGSKHLELPRAL